MQSLPAHRRRIDCPLQAKFSIVVTNAYTMEEVNREDVEFDCNVIGQGNTCSNDSATSEGNATNGGKWKQVDLDVPSGTVLPPGACLFGDVHKAAEAARILTAGSACLHFGLLTHLTPGRHSTSLVCCGHLTQVRFWMQACTTWT